MAKDPDFERIRRKAHELWEAEGQPHGRDQEHWDAAKEMVAIEDNHASTLLPRKTGAKRPKEPKLAVDSLGEMPGLTDQGRNDLTDVAREPRAKPARAKKAVPPAKAAAGKGVAEPKPSARAKSAATSGDKVTAPKPKTGRKKS